VAKILLIAIGGALVLLVTASVAVRSGVDPLYALERLNPLGRGDTAADASPNATSLKPQASAYKTDTEDLGLIPTGTVEFKYRLKKGDTMIDSWKANRPVYFEFHTVPDGKPLDKSGTFETFETAEKDQAHGVYTAPYTGLHGWYWQNRGKETVSFRLHTAGFYSEAVMISDDETTPMELKDLPGPDAAEP
jgi:hypothetical protein